MTRKNRVLVVFSSKEIGGAEKSITRMITQESERVEYIVCTTDGEGEWSKWARSLGIDAITLAKNLKKQKHGHISITGYIRLIKLIIREKPDIIYCFGVKVCVYLRLIKAFSRSFKLVHAIRWNPDTEKPLDKSFRAIESKLGFLVDHYICNSKESARTILKINSIANKKVTVIYNGIEANKITIDDNRERSKIVLVVANLNPRKGHIEFLTCIKNIVNTDREIQFVFAGRDDMDGKVQNQAKAMGIYNKIKFVGFVENISFYYKKSAISVLPSLYGEGCPTSILESLGHGVPVIAYAVDGVPELVSDNKDGILIRKGDQNSMAQGILDLINDREKLREYGRRGRAKVASKFTLRNCLDRHNYIFENMNYDVHTNEIVAERKI